MREGYLALSSRPSDKSWQLSFKLPGYDALVLDPTCSYQVNAYYYIFSNGPVRMVVGVSDEDPGILVETDEDVTITVTFWPSIEKDIQKIQKAFNKYIFTESYYANSSIAGANPDSLATPDTTVEEVYEQEYDADDDTYEPEVTPIEEVSFNVALTEEDGKKFYDGSCTPVFSDLIRKLEVSMSSCPDPSYSYDIDHLGYVIDYSGQIGKDAVAVMTQWKDKKVVADFVFEDGSRQKYAVNVYDYTDEDLWDREIGLGRLVLLFRPKGYQTKTNVEIANSLMLCNRRNISRIEFGDRSVELLKHGFQTKLLFGPLFSKMEKKGAFGEAPLEEKATASSQKPVKQKEQKEQKTFPPYSVQLNLTLANMLTKPMGCASSDLLRDPVKSIKSNLENNFKVEVDESAHSISVTAFENEICENMNYKGLKFSRFRIYEGGGNPRRILYGFDLYKRDGDLYSVMTQIARDFQSLGIPITIDSIDDDYMVHVKKDGIEYCLDAMNYSTMWDITIEIRQ